VWIRILSGGRGEVHSIPSAGQVAAKEKAAT